MGPRFLRWKMMYKSQPVSQPIWIGPQWCLDGSWCHRIHPDGRTLCHGQALRKRQDGGLYSGIVGKKRLGLSCQIGGIIDDTSPALRMHAWQHLCAGTLVAHEIEIPGGQPVVIGGLVQR